MFALPSTELEPEDDEKEVSTEGGGKSATPSDLGDDSILKELHCLLQITTI